MKTQRANGSVLMGGLPRTVHRPHPRGYTLMEMLTVQAVLVALIALSWPALRGSLQRNELVNAARQVRTELLKTRQTAIETGGTREFLYQPDGTNFAIVASGGTAAAATAGRQETSSGTGTPVGTNRTGSVAAQANPTAGNRPEIERRLPNAIHFGGPSVAEQSHFEEHFDGAKPGARPAVGSESDWAPPITFYPNGRTSNARIRLEGKDKHFVELALRGVTGTVAISEVRHESDSSEEGSSDRNPRGDAPLKSARRAQISSRAGANGAEVP